MKKYVLLAVFASLALPLAALDPLGAYRVRPPVGCVDKDVTAADLTLEDLVQISLCTNPSLAAAYMGVKAQEATLGMSRAEYLPSVTVSAAGQITGQRVENQPYIQDEPYAGKAEASWLLFDFGGREARTSSTKAYVRAAASSVI